MAIGWFEGWRGFSSTCSTAAWRWSGSSTFRRERLRREVERYAKDLELAGLSDSPLALSYTPGVVSRYAVREGLSLLVGLPLAAWRIANHVIPYQLTNLAARVGRSEPDTEATLKLAAGLVLYPLCWLGEAWTAWRLGGGWLVAVFLASVVPTGFFALTWRERLDRVRRDARGFLRFLVDRDLLRRLVARRRAVREALMALADLVAAAVVAAETTGSGAGDRDPSSTTSGSR